MVRKKVKLQYITNDSSRRAAFRKRRKGLVKKLSELSTLCAVQACAIIFHETDDQQPKIWPPERNAVLAIINKFNELPETEKVKKMQNQEGFVTQRLLKMSEQIEKLVKENAELAVSLKLKQGFLNMGVMHTAGIEELHALVPLIETKHVVLKDRALLFWPQGIPGLLPPSQAVPPLPPVPAAERDMGRQALADQSSEDSSMESFLNSIMKF